MPPLKDESGIAEELLDAIREELDEERSRKASIESRLLTLSGAAAASLAILFGLGKDYSGRYETGIFIVLLLAGVCFAISIFLAWRGLQVRDYEEIKPDDLRSYLTDLERESDGLTLSHLRQDLCDVSLRVLEGARGHNDTKAGNVRDAVTVLGVGAGFIVVLLLLLTMARLK